MTKTCTSQAAMDLEGMAGQMLPPAHRLPLSVARAVQVLRNYRWSQMARRIGKLAKQRFSGRRLVSVASAAPPPRPREDQTALTSLAKVFVNWRGGLPGNRLSNVAIGSILLLNQRCALGSPLDWKFERAPAPPQLWRFQLHYQEYLLAAAHDGEESARVAWQCVDSWIAAHPSDGIDRTEDAWHSYCISRRLPVWIWLWNSAGPPTDRSRVLGSIRDQANFLAANLEFDPGGNHLLENLTALGLAASFLDDPQTDHWFKLVERHLPRELRRQVLPHGEHFERAPTYHCQVVGNLLALAAAARAARPALADGCAATAKKMLEFLSAVVHPDGEIPLFGDSGFGESPGVPQIRELANVVGLQWPQATASKQVGPYWVQRRGRSAMILDAGEVGARELPAHAHCDMLSLEMSIEGSRWFVDSGNYNYEGDSMRRYCRSAVGHNVVTVDDREPCDVWSKFRMGFRGRPTQFEHGQRSGADWAWARHNAYRSSGVPHHDRLVVNWGSAWLCGDFCHTRRRPKLVGYLHLSPGLVVESLGERRFAVGDQTTRRRLDFFGVDGVLIAEGWYCPAFGVRQRNQCLVYLQSAGSQSPLGWLLDDLDSPSSVEVDGERLFLRMGAATFEWSFD